MLVLGEGRVPASSLLSATGWSGPTLRAPPSFLPGAAEGSPSRAHSPADKNRGERSASVCPVGQNAGHTWHWEHSSSHIKVVRRGRLAGSVRGGVTLSRGCDSRPPRWVWRLLNDKNRNRRGVGEMNFSVTFHRLRLRKGCHLDVQHRKCCSRPFLRGLY